jgi:DNA-binding NtrC family response regulator
MADPSSHAIVLHSENGVSLRAERAGPLALMVGDALSLVAGGEPQSAEKKPALLLVDDDKPLLAYLSELLAPHFSVVCTLEGSEAASLIANSDFDVIVASVLARGVNGAALYLHVQEVKPHLSERFIFTSRENGEPPAIITSGRVLLRKPVRLDQWDEALIGVLKKTRPARYRSVESVFLL